MAKKVSTWVLDFVDKITAPLGKANQAGVKLGDCFKRLNAMNLQAIGQGVENLNSRMESLVSVGANFDAAIRQVSAITGVTGDALDELGDQARDLSKEFGSSATNNLEIFQTILSRLGPQIADSAVALGDMGKYANTLSKTMGGDVVGATDALTTAMLQFRVDLNDPIKAAGEMERMMNVIAAGAAEGAAEVPAIGESLKQAGVAASLANLSFEETNSAIQAMAAGGKIGSEAGVAIRNVITSMSATSKLTDDAINALDSYGVSIERISDTTVPFAERLKELAPIQNDINALTLMFGRENAAAAQILISSADNQAALTEKITGTNTAYTQAEVVMDGWLEKMSRAKAWIDDLKIGMFDVTSVLSVVTEGLSGTLMVMSDFYTVLPLLKSIKIGQSISQVALDLKWMNMFLAAGRVETLGFGQNMIQASVALVRFSTVGIFNALKGVGALILSLITGGTTSATFSAVASTSFGAFATSAKVACKAVGTAIKSIPIIGWVAAAISALILLYNKFDKFRAFVNGIGASLKAIFTGDWGNIGKSFSDAYDKTIADAKKEKEKEGNVGLATITGDGTTIDAKTITGDVPPVITTPTTNTTDGGGTGSKIGLSGGSGSNGSGKSVTMNVTLNITNNGIKDVDTFTEQVVRKINDRLSDALAVA
jgi:TP901 family phage tail tape measure protein